MKIHSYNWGKSGKCPVKICFTRYPEALNMHNQRELELMYFYSTSGCSYIIDGETYVYNNYDLAVVNSGQLHGCSQWGRDIFAVCIVIDTVWLNIPSVMNMYFRNKISNNTEIINIFNNLKDSFENVNEINGEFESYIISIIFKLISQLCRYTLNCDNKPCYNNKDFAKVFKYINDNIENKITLNQLSKIMHLSDDRFYHLFKEKTGVSPTGYIMLERINKSLQYLNNTNYTITEIAGLCGFCTGCYYAECFKKVMRISPTGYRKLKGDENKNV